MLVATRSVGKQKEFRTLLRPIAGQILFPDDFGIDPSPDEALIESHATFEANAAAKARWFARQVSIPVIADDSGLEVDALGGAPGVRSKRFAGLDGPDEVVAERNVAALLDRLAGIPDRDRTARYRTVLVLVRAAYPDRIVAGSCEGKILDAPRGTGGFGYDPVFYSSDLQCTFAEALPEAKGRVSHRARAVAAMVEALRVG
ncbi:MAG TPA: non-canonical purine NTP pyrophosphatase [Gemmatimonadales bacterium]